MTPTSQYIDKHAEPNSPTSRFLLNKEFSGVVDNRQNRLNFIFRHEIPLTIDRKVGELLTQKYPSIEAMGDGLDEMLYLDLKRLAIKRGINVNDTFVKKVILIDMIRNLQ
jgi:hypothetical protein|tara:strand:- start:53 stop:382 length:330 start_codon:yes stop_codon:yes gene_type:complete